MIDLWQEVMPGSVDGESLPYPSTRIGLLDLVRYGLLRAVCVVSAGCVVFRMLNLVWFDAELCSVLQGVESWDAVEDVVAAHATTARMEHKLQARRVLPMHMVAAHVRAHAPWNQAFRENRNNELGRRRFLS
jgi:hypothetical protein